MAVVGASPGDSEPVLQKEAASALSDLQALVCAWHEGAASGRSLERNRLKVEPGSVLLKRCEWLNDGHRSLRRRGEWVLTIARHRLAGPAFIVEHQGEPFEWRVERVAHPNLSHGLTTVGRGSLSSAIATGWSQHLDDVDGSDGEGAEVGRAPKRVSRGVEHSLFRDPVASHLWHLAILAGARALSPKRREQVRLLGGLEPHIGSGRGRARDPEDVPSPDAMRRAAIVDAVDTVFAGATM